MTAKVAAVYLAGIACVLLGYHQAGAGEMAVALAAYLAGLAILIMNLVIGLDELPPAPRVPLGCLSCLRESGDQVETLLNGGCCPPCWDAIERSEGERRRRLREELEEALK